MTAITAWDILAAAGAIVPRSMTYANGEPAWDVETLSGNGWIFEVEYDGGDVDLIIAYTPPGGERVEPNYARPDLDERILFNWRGPGDLARLREADWMDHDQWLRECDEADEATRPIERADLIKAKEMEPGAIAEAVAGMWRDIAQQIVTKVRPWPFSSRHK